jgi:hypothetical protein
MLTAIPHQTSAENASIALSVSATDPDADDVLSYSASGLPQGLTINAMTGIIGGTISYTASGLHGVTVTVADGRGAANSTASTTFVWTVTPTNRPPTLPVVPSQMSVENAAITLVVAANDPDGDAVTFSATGLPPGLTIHPTTGTITGTLSYTSAGTHAVTVIATDPASATGSRTFTWTVTNLNRGPVLTAVANQTSPENATVSLPLVASDADGTTLTYSAYGLPASLTVNSTTGVIAGTLTYTSAGTYNVTATVSDGPASASRSFTWTVTNVNQAPVQTRLGDRTSGEHATIMLPLAASDPDGDGLSYSVTGLPASLTLNPATGVIVGTLSFTSAGSYRVTSTVSDGSLTSSQTFTWTVVNCSTRGDFDGDGKTDASVYRPATGTWYIQRSDTSTLQTVAWGTGSDVPVLGDYDGDGTSDIAVYRPSTGTWYVRRSSTSTLLTVAWGGGDDVPAPGDYDGDGNTDIAVYRPSTGTWYILRSSTSTLLTMTWGGNNDVPVPGDYDGDGKTDVAVYRRSTGEWYVLQSGTSTLFVVAWGGVGDSPVPADYDGDGKTDIGVYRPATGMWYLGRSSTNWTTASTHQWGTSEDLPVTGDYDGDGKTDIAVYRPATGSWFVLRSSTNSSTGDIQWGGPGDIPVLRTR